VKNRLYSLLVPWFMDGSLSLVQTAMPLLAVRLGADALALGTISLVAQCVRLPICFTSGPRSERVGRKTLIVPSAVAIIISYALFARAHSIAQIVLLYTLALASIGGFYPALQAMIGDVSRRGQLTRNLGAFNIGWCVGGGLAALAAKPIMAAFGLRNSFYFAMAWATLALVVVLIWRKDGPNEVSEEDRAAFAAQDNPALLIVSRMGMFTAFFGYTMVRMLFPKLAVSSLHWSDLEVAWSVAFLPVGQGVGMLATTATPWWRGAFWPQVGAQLLLGGSGVMVALYSSPTLLAAAFGALGFAQSITYTSALYQGLAARRNRGRNTGIHEGIVASGGITGSLAGGVVAQWLSPRAPYVVLTCAAAVCLITTATICLKRRGRKQ
jgi:MFS family permease